VVTQKDVAARAGVSFITVSRVVNGLGNVKEDTRKRVQEVIEELNYHPNHLGKALNSGRNSTIGVVAMRPFEASLEANLYLIGLLDGIEKASRARQCDLLLSAELYLEPGVDFLRLYRQRKVDGLIFVGFQNIPEKQIAEIESMDLPAISISDRPATPAVSWVDTDNLEAGRKAAEIALQAGHRDLAFVSLLPRGSFSNQNILDRRDGFLEGVGGCSEARCRVIESDLSIEGGRQALRDLMTLKPRPTCVVCGNDNMALGLMQEAQVQGLNLPGDLSVMGFDGFLPGRFHNPGLASFRQPLSAMGAASVELLFERLDHPERGKASRVFSLEYVDGRSLARITSPSSRL